MRLNYKASSLMSLLNSELGGTELDVVSSSIIVLISVISGLYLRYYIQKKKQDVGS
jgi:hypothetical protein